MSNATATLATHQVLYSRASNENLTTPMYPTKAYVEGSVDLDATDSFCLHSDDNRLVEGKLFEVREVALPSFLSVAEWVNSMVAWKWAWGCGVDPTWCEAWQRALAFEIKGTAERVACAKLLGTKKFRSDFRRSLRDQLVTWIETPAEERQYGSLFSARQWDCLINRYVEREAQCLDSSLYQDRSYGGAPMAA